MRKKLTYFFTSFLLFSCVTGNQINYNFEDTFEYNKPEINNVKNYEGMKIGIGSFDITGEASDQVMGGYVVMSQKTKGIHNRMMARAFVFCDKSNNFAVYVSIDDWTVALAVREAVVAAFQNGTLLDENNEEITLLSDDNQPIFNTNNIMISATHTHHGVSGTDQHEMYSYASGGFNQKLFDSHVRGISLSIIKAYKNLQPAKIKYDQDALIGKYNMNRNRSLEAHLNNKDLEIDISIEEYSRLSDEEKIKWQHHYLTTDKEMYMLKFFTTEDKPLGLINWYAVHPTSMSAANRYISGDSKGVAANMFERAMGNRYNNNSGFVAAFAQGAAGDSANLRRIWRKGFLDYTEEEEIINVEYGATAQVAKAMEIFCSEGIDVEGEISCAIAYVDFRNIKIEDRFRYKPEIYSDRTAPSANGYSFAMGSEVNQMNLAGIREGMTTNEKNWKVGWIEFLRGLVYGFKDSKSNLARILYKTKEMQEAHNPKPILFSTSQANPEWMPPILPIQTMRIGNILFVSIPFESTTMSARRIKNNIYKAIEKEGIKIDKIIFSPYTNAYASYMTTPEEYEMQHYEGGSSLFGINQQPATMQETERVFYKMLNGKSGKQVEDPEWICDKIYDLEGKILYQNKRNSIDTVLAGRQFGEQISKLKKTEYLQGEQIQIAFYGSNLNNDYLSNSSYITIQRYIPELEKWVNAANERDYHTTTEWKKKSPNSSEIIGRWRIPYTANEGNYRMVCQGAYKAIDGEIYQYSNISETFKVKKGNNIPLANKFETIPGSNFIYNLKIDVPISATRLILSQRATFNEKIIYAVVSFDDGTSYPVANMCELGSMIEIVFPKKDKIKECKLTVIKYSGDNPDLIENFMLY
ncbi:MAG: neutral/alkaline non-lysosomal ceramidase N-terminal domain-containing protein [Spirochaetales bacterium]|nr:neutral/alkaline non-lysosomal ceramidase N-terminal domain-containing protein [Spirochaetales bacterium]